jgi:hypothetical protein
MNSYLIISCPSYRVDHGNHGHNAPQKLKHAWSGNGPRKPRQSQKLVDEETAGDDRQNFPQGLY